MPAPNSCCNPLEKAKHNRVYKNIHLITDKWKPIFVNLIGKFVCDSCQRTINKNGIVVKSTESGYLFFTYSCVLSYYFVFYCVKILSLCFYNF